MTEPKQLLFCHEYFKDFNATKAALRAGYSEKSAYSIGNENQKKPEIFLKKLNSIQMSLFHKLE